MRRPASPVLVALISVLMALLLLTACGGNSSHAGKAAATPTATPMPTHPTGLDSWQVYIDQKFGFRIEVASYLYRNDLTVYADSEVVQFAASDTARYGMEDIRADVYTQPDAGTCTAALSGDRVTVGPGIVGYQRLFVPQPPPPGGATSGLPVLSVRFLAGGTLTMLSLLGDPPADTFAARYDLQWQHLLATFVSGPDYPGAHVCQ